MTAVEFSQTVLINKQKAAFYSQKGNKKQGLDAAKTANDLENNSIKRGRIAKYYAKTRDTNDRRKKVARAVFSYYDANGLEYRKSFTLPVNTRKEAFYDIAPEVICF